MLVPCPLCTSSDPGFFEPKPRPVWPSHPAPCSQQACVPDRWDQDGAAAAPSRKGTSRACCSETQGPLKGDFRPQMKTRGGFLEQSWRKVGAFF